MTRQRRSLRLSMTKPTAVSRDEQFEHLINRAVESGRGDYALRELQLPNHIFAEVQSAGNALQPKSSIELLPTDVLLNIVNLLDGNDQVMLALSSKVLASVVENSPVRKIVNIRYNSPRLKEWKKFRAFYFGIPSQQEFHLAGYGEVSSYHNKVYDQHTDMHRRIRQWLGPLYKFCGSCSRFRLIDEKWWLDFIEYENPGLLFKTPDRGSKRGCGQTKAETLIREWIQTSTGTSLGMSEKCPVHDLLKERQGRRLIKTT